MFWTIIPKPFPESVLLTCCTSEYGHIQRYLVLDIAWAITRTSAFISSGKNLSGQNDFRDILAELGVDKRLIKNKKIFSIFLEKEEEYQDNEHSKTTRSHLQTAKKTRKQLMRRFSPIRD